MSDDDLFQQAMGAVQPIQRSDKVHNKKKKPLTIKAANPVFTQQQASLSHHILQQESEWTWRASGISRGKLKRLAAGEPAIDVELDLHGMNRDGALQQLAQCVQRMLAVQQRVLCVVHGRGKHSQDQNPILKGAVYQWLSQGPLRGHVLAIIPTPYSQGGSCLVMLRRIK